MISIFELSIITDTVVSMMLIKLIHLRSFLAQLAPLSCRKRSFCVCVCVCVCLCVNHGVRLHKETCGDPDISVPDIFPGEFPLQTVLPDVS